MRHLYASAPLLAAWHAALVLALESAYTTLISSVYTAVLVPMLG